MKKLENNVRKVALILEGGGMRAAFSSGIITTLLENEIYFDYMAGISAGTSLIVNYMSRDIDRTKKSFIDVVEDPNFGGWNSFIKGKGFFNADYIYRETSLPDGTLPLDLETFFANPAEYRMVAFDIEAGTGKTFTEKDVHSFEDLLCIVKASSSLPIWMPPTEFRGRTYYDGGLTGGVALDVAINDGYDKFFVVRTQEKSYRKPMVKRERFFRKIFEKHPHVAQAIINRPKIYNDVCDRLDELEKQGKAYIVYPDHMSITNRERHKEKLTEIYEMGYSIGQRDVAKWKKFIEEAEK